VTELQKQFNQAMLRIYERARDQCRYTATRFLSMLHEKGGLATAKALLATSEPSSGLVRLWQCGRLDLSVEAHVLKPEFASLFTERERWTARERLEAYKYDFAQGEQPGPPGPATDQQRPDRKPFGQTEPEIMPTLQDLRAARDAFEANEPRDLFYRAATELVVLALQGATSLSIAKALAVLLQTWNRAYYQFRPFDSQHFERIERLLKEHLDVLRAFRKRSIEAFVPDDDPTSASMFTDFEQVLGPVGAAKSLHLLAPRFFPLWDRAIAEAYGLALGRRGTNAKRYLRFMSITRSQCTHLKPGLPSTWNLLKAIDEYNYCKFTKEWI